MLNKLIWNIYNFSYNSHRYVCIYFIYFINIGLFKVVILIISCLIDTIQDPKTHRTYTCMYVCICIHTNIKREICKLGVFIYVYIYTYSQHVLMIWFMKRAWYIVSTLFMLVNFISYDIIGSNSRHLNIFITVL